MAANEPQTLYTLPDGSKVRFEPRVEPEGTSPLGPGYPADVKPAEGAPIQETGVRRQEAGAKEQAANDANVPGPITTEAIQGLVARQREAIANADWKELRDRAATVGVPDRGTRQSLVEDMAKAIEPVPTTDGTWDYGRLGDDLPSEAGVQPAPVLLQAGSHNSVSGSGFGLAHILGDHAKEIEKHGYSDARDFVRDIVQNYTEAYRQPNGRLLLVKRNGKSKIGVVDMDRDVGGFYSVITAFTGAKNRSFKGQLLAEGRHAALSRSEQPGSPGQYTRADTDSVPSPVGAMGAQEASIEGSNSSIVPKPPEVNKETLKTAQDDLYDYRRRLGYNPQADPKSLQSDAKYQELKARVDAARRQEAAEAGQGGRGDSKSEISDFTADLTPIEGGSLLHGQDAPTAGPEGERPGRHNPDLSGEGESPGRQEPGLPGEGELPGHQEAGLPAGWIAQKRAELAEKQKANAEALDAHLTRIAKQTDGTTLRGGLDPGPIVDYAALVRDLAKAGVYKFEDAVLWAADRIADFPERLPAFREAWAQQRKAGLKLGPVTDGRSVLERRAAALHPTLQSAVQDLEDYRRKLGYKATSDPEALQTNSWYRLLKERVAFAQTMEADQGRVKVARNWGGKSREWGESWTTDPVVTQSRNSLGLETTNTAEYLFQGVIVDNSGVRVQKAVKWGRFAGGGQETLIPNAKKQVRVDAWTMPGEPMPFTLPTDPLPLPPEGKQP